MSISRYHRFPSMFNPQCDRCGALDRAGWSQEEAERIAAEDGWRATEPDGKTVDLCPVCRRRQEEQATADLAGGCEARRKAAENQH